MKLSRLLFSNLVPKIGQMWLNNYHLIINLKKELGNNVDKGSILFYSDTTIIWIPKYPKEVGLMNKRRFYLECIRFMVINGHQ
jgi:hypothetical protein